VIRRGASTAKPNGRDLPSREFLESVLASEVAAQQASVASAGSLKTISFTVLGIASKIEKLITEPLTNLCTTIYERAKSFVNLVLSSAAKTISKHPTVVVWIGGITIVAVAGVVAYTFWYRPAEGDKDAIMAARAAPDVLQNAVAVEENGENIREALGDLPTCLVCMDSFPRYACTQCGNLVLCQSDLASYTNTHGHKCPICAGQTPFLLIRAP
jgi:hypothetical protein